MKLVARAGTCMEEGAVICEVLDVLTSGDTLVLTRGDENTWMNVGPGEDTLTDDYSKTSSLRNQPLETQR